MEKLTSEQNQLNITNKELQSEVIEQKSQCLMLIQECEQLKAEVVSKQDEIAFLQSKMNQNESEASEQCRIEFNSALEQKNVEIDRMKLELERLRHHLIQVEDNYTKEFIAVESELQMSKDKLIHLDQVSANSKILEE